MKGELKILKVYKKEAEKQRLMSTWRHFVDLEIVFKLHDDMIIGISRHNGDGYEKELKVMENIMVNAKENDDVELRGSMIQPATKYETHVDENLMSLLSGDKVVL